MNIGVVLCVQMDVCTLVKIQEIMCVCVFVHMHDYMCVYELYVSVCFYLCIIGGNVEMYVPMYMSVSMCACVHTRHV